MYHRHYYSRFPVDFSELTEPDFVGNQRHRTESSRSLLQKPDFFHQIDGFIDKTESTDSSLATYKEKTPRKWICRNLLTLFFFTIASLFMLFYFSQRPLMCPMIKQADKNLTVFDDQLISDLLINLIDANEIRWNLEWLTEKVHVAGTLEQLNLMDKISEKVRFIKI